MCHVTRPTKRTTRICQDLGPTTGMLTPGHNKAALYFWALRGICYRTSGPHRSHGPCSVRTCIFDEKEFGMCFGKGLIHAPAIPVFILTGGLQ
ncbi:hypothetical protein NEUTE2DRAFT_65535 [Neurospora tetrasperma FGSC 2509]|nr:hypothetical protein NEUTE2DRAFT_65535 [Neurospora tetrasperma FGSC 2509]